MKTWSLAKCVAVTVAGTTLAACGSGGPATRGGSSGLPVLSTDKRVRAGPTSPISHVVFIVQENRSFNNLFLGYPGATTRRWGYDSSGNKVALKPEDLSSLWDLDHFSRAYFTDCDGQGRLPGTDCKMDGWNNEVTTPGAPQDAPYGYVPRKEIEPYWKMAHEYVLADKMFASNLDGSFVAHQYAVAAYAAHAVDAPTLEWGCEGGKGDTILRLTKERTYGSSMRACFDIPTIGNEADDEGITWRFYAGGVNSDCGLWSSYQADSRVYRHPDWKSDVINPPTRFLADVGKGELANITWITPSLVTSDHPGLQASEGPAWVASLVNAIGASRFWKTSAIFIMWDDWGGWFDPVPPVYEDYDGLGFRVPLIVVSPYAKQGYVTHVQYETASVLRYIEDNFGLLQLSKSDARANDPATDAFDYVQQPRAFEKIPGGKPLSYWQKLKGGRCRNGIPPNIIGDD